MHPNDTLSIEYALRLAQGRPELDTIRWLQDGLSTWINCSGSIPLERCLKLPTTPAKFTQLRRNYWLCKAAATLDASSSWQAANLLADELNVFMSRGLWRSWRHMLEAPEDASALRTALFYVAKAHQRMGRTDRVLTARQIDRIIRHHFSGKCHH